MPAKATITTGVAMPSLSPLSTLRVCRIRFGTRRSDITAEPRAASVGASAAPSSRAYQGLTPSSVTAAKVPRAMVRGSPTASSRT